ncbi:protein of unknown function DUF305 [Gordonia bronchialis DSM 43247]|uniref:DUF305 domain-containing protein n=1 Tax=Gordonia bronchialis (strain ATCC 25592 / DSM 43247 / BCRC 13721 / JCM 3198 / KCTC 3076 / NBRC 16047 / NCTC 10667) TaxID=526226 RepID=D0LEV3_GORB4|nr:MULTISPECIES: DUF305 domain-containing protein [Gordonia]ACY21827.1 protein of unknown function DUF305 [Gordonia bronchialis DSM 43247]MCC3324614.1 DUF305 domain-containing protein [Gordonia bronchialis]QGS26998.1 DUF305 domain-containing protein [Gordonia bronchialis]STQ64723.1 Uncharacterized protein conserved in bacteria [Gordonia bronchialis]
MRATRTGVVVAAAAAVLTVVAACSDTSTEDHSSMSGMGTSTVSTESSAAATAEHNSADISFAQQMIPHHTQAIMMSDILLEKDNINPQVVSLAQQIKDAQQPEIEQMQSWLEQWGAPLEGQGHNMDMGTSMAPGSSPMPSMMGMMSPEQMQQLRDAQGAEASRLFLTQMIEHHRGAIAMAKTEIQDGQSPEAIALARQIVTDQESEIARMQQLLNNP